LPFTGLHAPSSSGLDELLVESMGDTLHVSSDYCRVEHNKEM